MPGGRSRRQHSATIPISFGSGSKSNSAQRRRGSSRGVPPPARRLHATANCAPGGAAAAATAGQMSAFCMPMLIINMGGEMVYILEQRLHAQNVPMDKSKRGAH